MKSRVFFLALTLSMALAMVGPVTAQEMTYKEAPMLAEMVAAGELPPVEERLPAEPLVVAPYERIGVYGGAWHMGLRGGGDEAMLLRTVGYEGLVRWNVEWTEVVPNIAKSWDVNPEGTEYTFHLREGMKWSDGVPFTADDILFWYEDMILNTDITPAPPNWMVTGGEVGVVEKIDDYTVKFTFKEPNGLFLQRLSTPDGTAVVSFPRHWLEQFHIKYNPDNIDALVQEAGLESWRDLFILRGGSLYDSGVRWQNPGLPTLHAWVTENPLGAAAVQVTLTRNPYYWKVDPEGNQYPYIDRLVYDVGEDVQALVLKALNGEIDMQDRHISGLENKAVFFDNMEAGGYRFFDTIPASMNTMIIALNLTHEDPVKREIFNNKDFRIGLSYAINRQEIIDVVFVGQGEPYQPAPRPTSPFYNEELAKQYTEYNVDLANEHLDKAGYTERDADGFRLGPDGKRISFVVETVTVQPTWVDSLELISGYWRAVGIDVQVTAEDRSIFYERKDANQHDAVVWGGDGGLDVILEPRWYFPFSNESGYAELWQYYYNGDPRGEAPPEGHPVWTQWELYDQLKATADADQQAELMKQILQISQEEFYAIGISLPAPGYGIVKNNFFNVPPSFPNAWLYPHPGPVNTFTFFIEG